MKKLLLSLCLVSTIALAGHDTGGGGIGLQVQDKIYLYDFVEGGIEDNVYINASIADSMNAATSVRATLLVSKEAQNLVVAKLNEIYKLSPSYALKLVDTMKSYQWRFVKPSLIATRDIGRTPIDVALAEKQLAFRDDAQKTVTIDKDSLAKMPILHQVGLYFHEIIYALSGESDSYKSRIFNAYLFHPSFEFASFEQFSERVSLMHGSNYTIMDLAAYTYVNSAEFTQKCTSTKEAVLKFNVAAMTLLEEQNNLIEMNYAKADEGREVSATLQNNTLWEDFSRKSEFQLDNVVYTVPKNGFIPTNVYRHKRTMIVRDSKINVFYSMKSASAKQIETNKVQAAKYLNSEKIELFNSCLSQNEKRILNYISTVKLILN